MLLIGILIASVVGAALAAISLVRGSKQDRDFGNDIRNDLRTGREETRTAGKELREEISTGIRSMDDALRRTLENHGTLQQQHFEGLGRLLAELTATNQAAAESLRATLDGRVKDLQESNESKLEAIRKEVSEGLKANAGTVATTLDNTGKVQQEQLRLLTKQVADLSDLNQATLERIRSTFDTRIKEIQEGNDTKLDTVQRNVSESLKATAEILEKSLQSASLAQQTQLEAMTRQLKELSAENQAALDKVRDSLDSRVKELQTSNESKLDEMRKTVDEKLQDTLEKRLGESFKFVSDRLEAVHKGLGEMQTLASGVGDLKRVLTNVKVRGTWAEVQLGAILEQILIPDQWSKNVCVREGSSERVEFAVRLPGSKDDPSRCMWLAIDSKFPKEDYHRLQAAADAGDPTAVQAATDALLRELRRAAKDISQKYINPPSTTDFAIMFLATEGLYAEALRQPAFVEDLQQNYRITLAGPTTLAAILSSLRMGFQTLAVEKRAAEVWRVLGAVKTEFGKFGGVLEKVKRQLETASRTIEETGTRSRVLERKLRSVEQLDPVEASNVLALPTAIDPEEAEEEDISPPQDSTTDGSEAVSGAA